MGGESTREALLASLHTTIGDERVVAALGAVPRERFVPDDLRHRAWEDVALPLGAGQSISQPQVVALMCALLDVRAGDRVLDVGTGSGYHAAVLAALGGRVRSIERDRALSGRAGAALAAAGIGGVELLVGDGTRGDPRGAPFDAINVAAAAAGRVPRALVDQLAPGGRLVLPVDRTLVLVTRDARGRLHRRTAGAVRFVPLVGS